ncbi:MAG: hypothetical protein JSV97_06005 [candidate division WOR-3 bacterium]|nr:MAG: hypothetical protein JSV97_06005 [candidate division WOR-3 bacterium]
MSEKFKPPPFNYCDYRCERCDERERCRVYKDNAERILNHYAKGEDPYDPEIFFKDLHDIFEKTHNMLTEMAEKEGIDLEQAAKEEIPEENPEEYKIYCLAHEYYREANRFIKELEKTGIPETMREDFQDLVWYHTLITAKSGRLVSGFIDDFDEEVQQAEEEGTLKVINKGITLSKNALQNMLNKLPDHLYTIAHLMELLKTLEQQIQTDIHEKVDEEAKT